MDAIVKNYVKGWFQYTMLNANRRRHKGEIFSSSVLSNAEKQVVSQAKKRAKKIASSV